MRCVCRDWGPHIDVVGFLFLEEPQEQQYRPPPALAAFLAAGPPPVYIGFGSMVCQDPVKLTDTIFRAVDKVRPPTARCNEGSGRLAVQPGPAAGVGRVQATAERGGPPRPRTGPCACSARPPCLLSSHRLAGILHFDAGPEMSTRGMAEPLVGEQGHFIIKMF